MVTYGDGVVDINLNTLIAHHNKLRDEHGILGTITVLRPHSKYGVVDLDEYKVKVLKFKEKPLLKDYINIGFMVFEKKVFDYITDADTMIEEDLLPHLAEDGKLAYYKHEGFWHCMDTMKDYIDLNKLYKEDPKWKVWK